MTTGEAWHGPFDTRAEFETVQDNSIAMLARYACAPPTLAREPAELKDQLWEMGKFIPFATLGLARHNPLATKLHIWDKPLIYKNMGAGNRVGVGQGPTRLFGEEAYRRISSVWHTISNPPHDHHLEIESNGLEEKLGLTYSTIKNHSAVIGHSIVNKLFEQRGSQLFIPDTNLAAGKESVQWDDCMAIDGTPPFRSGGDPMPYYVVTPFNLERDDPDELSEASIKTFEGKDAVTALQEYGEVGLYQHILWTKTNKILQELNLGPARSL